MRWLRRLFYGKSLADHLSACKFIKCHDIRFYIRRIDPIDFMNGSRVMMECFAKYKVDKNTDPNVAEKMTKARLEEMKHHYIDVFMAGVVEPKLSRKKDDAGTTFVEYLLTDWALANDLYDEIVSFTYGKKKSSRGI